MTKTQKFIDGLPSSGNQTKKRIAVYLDKGLTPEKTAKIIAKENGSTLKTIVAYVTMVLDLASKKCIEFGEKIEAPYKFSYEKNKQKNFIHSRVVLAVLGSSIRNGKILTLSWKECIVEKMLYYVQGLTGLKFIACERDKPTYNELKNNIKANGWKFIKEAYNGEIGDKIFKAAKDTYAHIFLDYCGKLNTFEREIIFAIKNKIVQKDGIIWITVSRPFEVNTLLKLRKLIRKAGVDNYQVVFDANYRDGMGMTTFIIKRVK